ncbi:CDP-glucose 4,6-dehydratase [Mesorhizobium sp. VK23B]|uniref:CDP-glucose 4,6-dehydratase n=1 Tax=Mesorhizobium dulcispinae TaxID=3072316 RepID=A0ABU4XMD9_9HYPH|nr:MULTISPECIES: CDP-glucose 4,6-dehydratase [unclassified Mesorhizobium]MDX8469577.1 CDP-glucose 4,6-dehydratase [Mesorhizobium sp. VK23B]MDX8475916.1 CDP-glucose 4,6-dehydratase [Mesorhizobium sp. VK23A]
MAGVAMTAGAKPSADFWFGKRVLVTGHTGFKGSWICMWLSAMGAKVTGLSLDPSGDPSLYGVAGVSRFLEADLRCDIRDAAKLREAVLSAAPEIVLHLAAQPLVRLSYADPLATYATNVMGTAHLLEAVRHASSVRAVVNVTTDKCYENREWVWAYREDEAMGGHDPYSSSKGCSELVTAAYRRSFLAAAGVGVASARAGNVIGGGDWSADRLVPDFLRAIDRNEKLVIRSPEATRPWQHVLEPLSGYLLIAEALWRDGVGFAEGWNFGPDEDDAKPVRWIVETLQALRPQIRWEIFDGERPHEANMLALSSSKARARLNWRPRWRLRRALEETVRWHESWARGADMAELCQEQIRGYLDTPVS